jgi:hypothetical protein
MSGSHRFQTDEYSPIVRHGLINEEGLLGGFVGCRFAFHGDDDKLAIWSENVLRPL